MGIEEKVLRKWKKIIFTILVFLIVILGSINFYFGTKGTGTSIDFGEVIYGIEDIDGDGDLDVITSSGKILINQNGNFKETSSVKLGLYDRFEILDINDDSNNDILGLEIGGDEIDILRGIGNGNFQLDRTIGSKRDHIINWKECDLNDDGLVDLILIGHNWTELKLNQGGLEFSSLGFLNWSTEVVIGDLDLDLKDEIWLLGPGNFTRISYDNTDGLVQVNKSIENTYSYNFPYFDEHRLRDHDGDGDLDIHLFGEYSSIIFINNRDNFTFLDLEDHISNDLVQYSGDFKMDDLNGDGKFDLIITRGSWKGDDSVFVLLNQGDLEFWIHQQYHVGEEADSTIVDIDSDGDLDILTVNQRSGSISVLKNDGNGKFKVKNTDIKGPSSFLGETWTSSFLLADIDGDNDKDILIEALLTDDLLIAKNDGNGNFKDQEIYPLGDHSIQSIEAVSDIDSDGLLDIVLFTYSENHGYSYNEEMTILYARYEGDFRDKNYFLIKITGWSTTLIIFLIVGLAVTTGIIEYSGEKRSKDLNSISGMDIKTVRDDIELHFDLNKDDVIKFNLDNIKWRKYPKTLYLPSQIMMAILGLGTYGIYNFVFKPEWGFGLILFGTFFIPLILILFFYSVFMREMNERRVKKNAEILISKGHNSHLIGPTEIKIKKKHFRFQVSAFDTRVQWRGFKDFRESEDHFYLFTNQFQTYIIPKRCFKEPEDMKIFQNTVKNHMENI